MQKVNQKPGHADKPIEALFFESLLKVCLFGVLVVLSADYYFTGFAITRSAIIDFVILAAILLSFALYKAGRFTAGVLLIGCATMAAMFYQSLDASTITTSSMAVVMVIGFGFSVLLKGRLPAWLHVMTTTGMTAVFCWMALHPTRYGKPNASDIIVAGVTYVILYTILAYTSYILKNRYDQAIADLATLNRELIEKSNEIETQNEELVLSQENLSQLNSHLESLVADRTKEVQRQNQQLISYAYANAHHLRGPVARVLGLVQLSKLDDHLDYTDLFQKIEDQTREIDEVVKRINDELGA